MIHKHKPLFFILMPNSKFKIFWNLVIIALLLYTALYVPYKIAFLDDTGIFMFYFELCVDFLFICDIFVNFISAYELSDNLIEVRIGYIFLSYGRSWFLLDLGASVPT